MVIPSDSVHSRTKSYLRGRFRDYYRRQTPDSDWQLAHPQLPPYATTREWAYIPFPEGDSAPMIRHQAIADVDHLADVLVSKRPRHVYHSTAMYDEPGRDTMASKGWRGADLVFDLDADHLPDVDAQTMRNREMLSRCQDATVALLQVLEDDFGFTEVSVVFSGNRGFHVHVRDEGVHTLDRQARREIVEYVRGEGLAFDAIVTKETVTGPGGTSTRRHFETDSGWGRRVHRELVTYLDPLREQQPEDVVDELSTLEGIGPSRARAVAETIENRWSAIAEGTLDLHPDFVRFVRTFVQSRVHGSGPAIDEPVTTDVHRLIRLPGSLHGASGLVVQPIDRDRLASFDPLDAAIAPLFRSVDITIDVHESLDLYLGGEEWSLTSGQQVVPEYLGIFLMAREQATKERET